MTLDIIKQRIAEIRNQSHDDERAHGLEDKLHEDFIAFVRDHPTDMRLAEAAELVLSTREINFARWCA